MRNVTSIVVAALVTATSAHAAPPIQSLGDDSVRMKRAFPAGEPLKDPKARVGALPVPPQASAAPDGASEWYAEVAFPQPVLGATLEHEGSLRSLVTRVHSDRGWYLFTGVGDDLDRTMIDRVAVRSELISSADSTAITRDRIASALANAEAIAKAHGAPAPAVSASPDVAVAKAGTALALRASLGHNTIVRVRVVAPATKRISARALWESAYGAGFTWSGAGFERLPSDDDHVYGIDIAPLAGEPPFDPTALPLGSAAGRAQVPASEPEAATGGDVGGVELSFDVSTAWHPGQVDEAMLASAAYLASRLGGSVVMADGAPFDAAPIRAQVAAIEHAMRSAGVMPGTELARDLDLAHH